MNIMYYCIISVIVFIILLILVNIAFDDEELSRYEEPFVEEPFIIQAIAFCVAALRPYALAFIVFVSFIYFTNLAVKKFVVLIKKRITK